MKGYIIILVLMIGGLFETVQAQTYKADPEKTLVKWQGKKIGGKHHGTIELKSGELQMDGNKPVSGSIVIDMTTIIDEDIENDSNRERLEKHLKSDDFFGVDQFPEAKLEITGSEIKKGGPIKIIGNIVIKGITRPLEFVTDLTTSEETLIFIGHIDIDRTLFDVRYGSTKFFENIADRAINDIFALDYELYLEKK